MISEDFLFSEPGYWFYLFGVVNYWPKPFEAIGLENRDWIKTDTDIRTQVVLSFCLAWILFHYRKCT